MRRKRHPYGMLGRTLMALVAVMAVAALVAPAGLRQALAQETPTTTPIDVQTRGRFLHASPSLGKIEVAINWDEKLDEFEYGDLSDWIDLPPGATEVSMTADRRGFNFLVFDAVYPIPAGNDYYAVISDQIVITGAFDRTPVKKGMARVQVVQGSVSLPAVNVVATGSDTKFATQLQYPRTSDYTEVPAGAYSLDVTLADTGQAALSGANVTLNADTVYELVIMGNANDSDHPLEIRPLDDTTTPRS
ncbi:MAG TPA: DUF4397 domain-containing protein [Thermomicrobiales bacterium]|nr:DUF4397 domain-containing protein [Thermomicrobiales bacterium]